MSVDVLLIPEPTVTVKFCGAVAVTVTVPRLLQDAAPASSIVATTLFDVFQLSPSAIVNCRLVLSVKFPSAVNTTVPELTVPFAFCGLTVMLRIVGCPSPQPASNAADTINARTDTIGANRTYFIMGLHQGAICRVVERFRCGEVDQVGFLTRCSASAPVFHRSTGKP